MRTALTILIEKWQSEITENISQAAIYSAFIEEARKFLKHEQVSIQDAFDVGQANWDKNCRDIEDGKQYYQENFVK